MDGHCRQEAECDVEVDVPPLMSGPPPENFRPTPTTPTTPATPATPASACSYSPQSAATPVALAAMWKSPLEQRACRGDARHQCEGDQVGPEQHPALAQWITHLVSISGSRRVWSGLTDANCRSHLDLRLRRSIHRIFSEKTDCTDAPRGVIFSGHFVSRGDLARTGWTVLWAHAR
jgi:hypothetical protein